MIELRILGSQSLVGHEGREVLSILQQPKRFALLCYLATEAGAGYLRRDRLLGLLWPERQEAKARASLSEALSRLRQSLGPDAIVTRGNEEVGVAADRLWCDAAEFARAAREGRLEEAAELYRGDLLDGFILSDGADFDMWLEGERASLRRQALDVVSRLADEAAVAGVESARRWAERALELAPLDGVAVRRLMEVEARLGHTTSALDVFERFRARLGEERGVEPTVEVVELAERIRAGALLEQTEPSRALISAPADGDLGAVEAPLGIVGTHPSRRESGDASSRKASIWRRLRPVLALVVVASLGAFVLSLARADRDPTNAVAGDTPPIEAIAVLPLTDLAADPSGSYFTDGMTEALTSELGRIGSLRVTSSRSAMRYREAGQESLLEIARELGVDALLGGSVLRDGNRVRITVQLLHGSPDRHLWTQSYERDVGDVLALQSEVARAVAAEVTHALAPGGASTVLRSADVVREATGVNVDALEAYLHGRQYHGLDTRAGDTIAAQHYQEAIRLDSTFALAWGSLAEVCFELPGRSLLTCEGHALRALRLDERVVVAHTALGRIKREQWDWDGAETELLRAIELNPSDMHARFQYSRLLSTVGRGDEALEQIRIAAALDPLDRELSLQVATFVGIQLHRTEAYEAAIEQWESLIESDPTNGLGLWNLCLSYAQFDRLPEARACTARLEALGWNPNWLPNLQAYVAWRGGDRDQAYEILDAFRASVPYSPVSAYVYVLMGDAEPALEILEVIYERSYAAQNSMIANASSEHEVYGFLRDHPRFQALRRKMGLH